MVDGREYTWVEPSLCILISDFGGDAVREPRLRFFSTGLVFLLETGWCSACGMK